MLVLGEHYYFDTLDSTSNKAKELASQGCPEGTIVSAGFQTGGRGRIGRQWDAPRNETVATSIVLYPQIPVEKISSLSLVAGMAVCAAIESECGLQPSIKWPNDIILKKKKVCGILTEMSAISNRAQYVVIGIGVNVRNRSFPEELSNKATSLYLEGAGTLPSSEHLSNQIWKMFCKYYDMFLQTQDLSLLLDEYQTHLVNMEQMVRVLDPMGEYQGIARGINARGELLVETNQGMKTVASGEVSVRGLYGYV